jgi:hypothetical protein
MDIFAKFATDESKEEKGVWHPLGDSQILIARDGNKEYGRELGRLVEKHKVALEEKGEHADKVSDEIMIELLSKYIFIGHKGLTFKGEAVEDTPAGRAKLLAVKDFRKHVVTLSQQVEHYRVQAEEAAGKP